MFWRRKGSPTEVLSNLQTIQVGWHLTSDLNLLCSCRGSSPLPPPKDNETGGHDDLQHPLATWPPLSQVRSEDETGMRKL